MLRYSDLLPHHISMLLVALNAYGNTPFEGKLLKVGAALSSGTAPLQHGPNAAHSPSAAQPQRSTPTAVKK